ncbi:penicillin acylase family protein [Erythrobacter sanguineus]|uniref:Acyl-homoserine-lactone acylase n=1 Tax=Erythrobacter sanguineus TaxID=198312 RepID=A0A1M7SN05_9SPHN|nr:penicillin acylase family protein [Erythrobacter sanguineus]SHN59804.1 acyl-homoserine-lactone acylase [Erythrobacter sanguineus]
MRITLLASSLAALLLVPQAQARSQYEATITRTTYGIPHIEADSWGGVGYGVAYAYAEDNLCLLAEEFTTVAGDRSRHFGPDNTAVLGFQQVDNLNSDVFFRAMIDLPALRAGFADQGHEARGLAQGYVAGYNRFLKDAGPDGIPAECRGKAWVRAISLDDVLRLTEKQMLLASSLALAPGIAAASPPGTAKKQVAQALPRPGELGLGSNGWAFGGDATADGRGLVIGNPHFPWNGPSRFWQLHVTGPDGYDVMGVGIAGTPIPTLGFNRDVAWTHTVTAARHFTLHALVLDPADPTRYMLDGESVAMEPRNVTVPMPEGAADVTRTLYATRFGPVFVAPDSGVIWSASAAYAVQDANRGNGRAIDTWLRIGQARSVGEIKAAVSETLGIPWVNTIASDRHGDALHADITAVPNVSAQLIAACSTPLSPLFARLATLLDGSRSECNWQVAEGTPEPGLMPASDQAATIRRDYLTNSNDSYWLSNPRLPHSALSPVLGKHAESLSLRTRSNFTETEALLAAGKVDHARAKAMAFANKSLAADMAIEPLLALCAATTEPSAEAARGCAALAGWDRRYEADSRGAQVFRALWAKIGQRGDLWQVAFDPADPVNTPRDLATEGSTGDKLLAALGDAVNELDAAEIALDAPWGEVQRWIANGEAIPIHGGPGTAGVLNYQDARPAPAGGLVPVHGTSYIQIVGFDENGPVADAILSYSQSTDPASPHFADQTRAYAVKQWHRLPFTPEEIAEQAIGETRRIAE